MYNLFFMRLWHDCKTTFILRFWCYSTNFRYTKMYCKKCANKTQTQRLRRQTEGANCTRLPTKQHYKKHKISCQLVFWCFCGRRKDEKGKRTNRKLSIQQHLTATWVHVSALTQIPSYFDIFLNSSHTQMLHRAWLSLGQCRNNNSSSSINISSNNYYYSIYHQIIKAYGDDIQQHYKHFPSVELSRPDICFLSGVIP